MKTAEVTKLGIGFGVHCPHCGTSQGVSKAEIKQLHAKCAYCRKEYALTLPSEASHTSPAPTSGHNAGFSTEDRLKLAQTALEGIVEIAKEPGMDVSSMSEAATIETPGKASRIKHILDAYDHLVKEK